METIIELIRFTSFVLFCIAFLAFLREIWIWRNIRQPKPLSRLGPDHSASASIRRSRILSHERTNGSHVKWPKTGAEQSDVHEICSKVDAMLNRHLLEIDSLIENSGAGVFPDEMLASLYRIDQELGVAVEQARGYLPESPIERRPLRGENYTRSLQS
jgi:hypothetical protein